MIPKKRIDINLKDLGISSKKITKPATSFIDDKGHLIQTKYSNFHQLDDERRIIENSPVGEAIREGYAQYIQNLDHTERELNPVEKPPREVRRRKTIKHNKIKRCRCKK